MKKDSSASTLLVISMGFLALHMIFDWHWTLYTSLSVGLIGIFSSWLSTKIEWLWMKLAKVLSFIVPNILLSIVFFLFLFPIALLSRLFSKDPLMLSSKYDSYFVEVKKKFSKEDFKKIW